MKRPWVAFFSQTGTEIYNLIKELDIYPDCIVTNQEDKSKINKNLVDLYTFRETKLNMNDTWVFLPKKPILSNYDKTLRKFNNPLITLHGFLRILPKKICDQYEIYNLHPGLITKYPELKGFNPQERAYAQKYTTAGCVIHRVIPDVDEGPVVKTGEINIEGVELPEVYEKLHKLAFFLWKNFITDDKILEK